MRKTHFSGIIWHVLSPQMPANCLIFDFWHFPPIVVLLKVTCLVTLFDRKLQIFKNSPKWTIFGIFNLLLPIKNVNVARFARDVEWDFFCDFQTTWARFARLKVKRGFFWKSDSLKSHWRPERVKRWIPPFVAQKLAKKNFLVNFWMRAWLREEEFILNENWLEYIKCCSPEGLEAEGKTLVVNGSKLGKCFAEH